MPATLRSLTADPRFGFVPVSAIADAILDAPVLSAHSTDLPDPTPWLEAGQLLLTDGQQFASQRTDVGAYVDRLMACGVLALGFATEIVHDEIPIDLREACRAKGLPLFEVSQRRPFMAIIRHVADAVARDQQQMLEASLAAQRAVARAALRPDGLAAILQELEKNLGAWVAIYDASGRRVEVPTRLPMPESAVPLVERAVRRALDGGTAAGVRLSSSNAGDITLQTLGHSTRLRGVLAVGVGATLDRAANDLVDSVIALASIALEQSRALDDARRRLRSGVIELLHAGVLDVAGGAVRPLWGDLPSEPIRVSIASVPEGASDALHASLEVLADRREGQVFFAERQGSLVLVTPENGSGPVKAVLEAHGCGAGFSAPSSWADFRDAEAEARKAVRRLPEPTSFVTFESLAETGLLGHLEVTGARALARRVLRPLREEDDAHGSGLERSISVWLEHNGAWDPAAKELGIHRHTLRARIDSAGRILGMDLSTFGDRAEIWNVLQLTRGD